MVAIINTDPIIIGKSSVLRASTISFPNPFHPKIYSTNTAPGKHTGKPSRYSSNDRIKCVF